MDEPRLEDFLIDCDVCGEPCISGLCPCCEAEEQKPRQRKPQEFVKLDGKRRKPKYINKPRRNTNE